MQTRIPGIPVLLLAGLLAVATGAIWSLGNTPFSTRKSPSEAPSVSIHGAGCGGMVYANAALAGDHSMNART